MRPSRPGGGDATRGMGTDLSVVVLVQSLSCVRLFVTPWTATRQASLFFTISWSLLNPMSIESMMPSNHLILCCPLLLLLSLFPSISVFSNESVLCIRWPKYCSFSFSISPANEEQTHWKGLCFWETLKPGGEGDNRGWDGWMASPTRWIWAWASSREVWRPWGRKESDMTEQLNWTEGLRMCLCRFNTFPFISQRDFKILSLLEKESLLSRKNPGITRIQKLLHN